MKASVLMLACVGSSSRSCRGVVPKSAPDLGRRTSAALLASRFVSVSQNMANAAMAFWCAVSACLVSCHEKKQVSAWDRPLQRARCRLIQVKRSAVATVSDSQSKRKLHTERVFLDGF